MDLTQDPELIQEFLVETNQNLATLDLDMVELEKTPDDLPRLASVFRTIHTIKGTCGFLSFERMEKIAHVGENILNRLRNGEARLDGPTATLILDMVDQLRCELASVEQSGTESNVSIEALLARLEAADTGSRTGQPAAAAPPPPAPVVAPPVPAAAPPVPAAAQEPQAAAKPAGDAQPKGDNTIRIDVGLADKLVNLVGELVLVRNQLLQPETRSDVAAIGKASQRLNLITSELQESVLKTRMQPISVVWNKLPRIVRDLGVQLGKQINLVMEGGETEMDRTLVEAIRDPLTHIVRNSCDHGIELPAVRTAAGKAAQGRLLLRAYHESGQVVVEVSDDGGGIPLDKLRKKALEKGLTTADELSRMSEREVLDLIFKPGFSTAEQVSNISGRGVGMDVVRTNIQKIGGTVELRSRAGQGTTLLIRIPLTLAIISGLLVISGADRYVIPQASLVELVRLEGDNLKNGIEFVNDNMLLRRKEALLPLLSLGPVLGRGDASSVRRAESVLVVILQCETGQFGLIVDRILSTRDIVVKPLGKHVKQLGLYAGATILDDGSVSLILDVTGIARTSAIAGTQTAQQPQASAGSRKAHARQELLLFSAGPDRNLAVPLSLVGRLEKFRRADVEHSAGQPVVHYRGDILPLYSMVRILHPELVGILDLPDPVTALIIRDGNRVAGLAVDAVHDVRSEAIESRRALNRPGLLGAVSFGGHVWDLVDLEYVMGIADESWFRKRGQKRHPGAKLLVLEPGELRRRSLAISLELAGHSVKTGRCGEDAGRLARATKFDAVIMHASLAGEIASIRAARDLETIPILGLADDAADDLGPDFAAVTVSRDRKALLGAIDSVLANQEDSQ